LDDGYLVDRKRETAMRGKPEVYRLNQFLARCGAASRRKAEELILSRLVTINGQTADHPGIHVDPQQDVVRLRGRVLHIDEPLTLIVHKPKGVICSRSDPEGRKTLYDLLPKKMSNTSLQSVGRLDFDSSGLMVLTNDGLLHRLLEHPSSGIERVYQVKAKGELESTRARALLNGVELEDGMGRVTGVEMLRFSGGISRFLVTLQEGRNREVRRLCAAVGLEVLDLRRLSYGPFTLGSLATGAWRETTLEEDRVLIRMRTKAHKKASAAQKKIVPSTEKVKSERGSTRKPSRSNRSPKKEG
jgi:23S rRNA pseudouridine2605 synthase